LYVEKILDQIANFEEEKTCQILVWKKIRSMWWEVRRKTLVKLERLKDSRRHGILDRFESMPRNG
jgi:hypothetical protein